MAKRKEKKKSKARVGTHVPENRVEAGGLTNNWNSGHLTKSFEWRRGG